MIPILWRNIIIIVLLTLIIICIIYAIFRVQERNRVEENANKSNTIPYQLVWQDNFTEKTEIISVGDITDEIPGIADEFFFVDEEPTSIRRRRIIIDQDHSEDDNKDKDHNHCKKEEKQLTSIRRRRLVIDQDDNEDHKKDEEHNHSKKKDDQILEISRKISPTSLPKLPTELSQIEEFGFSEVFSETNNNILPPQIVYRLLNYNIWNALNLPGSIVGSSTGNYNEFSFYTNSTRNIFLSDYPNRSLLNLRTLNQIIEVASDTSTETFLFTTPSIITRGSFLRGYFTFKIRISSSLQAGGFPFIRLQSYINSSLNMIGNIYGGWPDSGEIDILEPLGYSVSESGRPQMEWTGKLWFSTQENPLLQVTNYADNINNPITSIDISGDNVVYQTAVPDVEFKPLKLDKFYTIGVEWLNDRIIWYKNAGMSVTGVPSGKIIGQISADKWWSVNTNGKLNPKPAPFDVARSINIGIATPGTRYPNNGNIDPSFGTDSIFNLEYIKVYSASTTASTNTTNTLVT